MYRIIFYQGRKGRGCRCPMNNLVLNVFVDLHVQYLHTGLFSLRGYEGVVMLGWSSE